MDFKDIKVGDTVYILESCGTFRKITTYNTGSVISVGVQYDDNTNPYLASTLKKKLIDITVSCEGVQKKLSVDANKNIITDNTIGLTIATDKQNLISLVDTQLKEYEAKIQSIQIYKDEADKCKNILNQLKKDQNIITSNEVSQNNSIIINNI